MKIIKKLILATFLITACFVFTGAVHAEDIATSPYITIYKPALKQVYYKGENISYNVIVTNPWSNAWCRPFVTIIDSKEKTVKFKPYGYMAIGEKWSLTGSFKTSNIKAAKYYFATLAMPIKPWTTTEYGSGNQKYAGKAIYIRTLKAPKAVKAVRTKKGIKITYNKAKGATKYYIYRSKSKNSGYAKIGTTTKTTFLNKSVKKGKRYYYKVKSVRTVNNTIVSKGSLKATAIAK